MWQLPPLSISPSTDGSIGNRKWAIPAPSAQPTFAGAAVPTATEPCRFPRFVAISLRTSQLRSQRRIPPGKSASRRMASGEDRSRITPQRLVEVISRTDPLPPAKSHFARRNGRNNKLELPELWGRDCGRARPRWPCPMTGNPRRSDVESPLQRGQIAMRLCGGKMPALHGDLKSPLQFVSDLTQEIFAECVAPSADYADGADCNAQKPTVVRNLFASQESPAVISQSGQLAIHYSIARPSSACLGTSPQSLSRHRLMSSASSIFTSMWSANLNPCWTDGPELLRILPSNATPLISMAGEVGW